MKLLLIAPASGPWRRVGRAALFNGRTFRFSLLSLLTVAAATPPAVEVVLADEQVDEVPVDGEFDLVGITAMTATAPRAYELAAAFRSRGIPVVLGGMHPTFLPDEALAHADAVVAGEAEGIWPLVVEDARRGRLSGLYRAEAPPCLDGLRVPPRHLMRGRHYGTLQAVQATRGCPHRCAFCSVSAFHGGAFRVRPVPDVVAEVSALPRRFFMFVDDSLLADRDYARELFGALRPLGRRWMSQATLAAAEDDELLSLAADSGCVGLFVGLETFSGANLAAVEKGFNPVASYRDRVRALLAHGIGVEAGVVFGFDGDDRQVFSQTLEGLREIEVDMVQASVLTPLPGTPFRRVMAGRILDRNWSHYDYHHVVFEPALMSPEALQAGHDWFTKEFYSLGRMAGRLARMASSPRLRAALPYAAAINTAYYGRVLRWHIGGWDPGREPGAMVIDNPIEKAS